MAISFMHDQETDLAIFTLTGDFNLDEWLSAARAGAFPPASLEIMDLRRCNLNAMRSMDLARFTRYLRSAMDKGRLIPGKTAIVANEDGPRRYSSAHRLFHNFSIFAEENKLPRDFKLFTTVKDALDWIGNREIIAKHAPALHKDASDRGADATMQASSYKLLARPTVARCLTRR